MSLVSAVRSSVVNGGLTSVDAHVNNEATYMTSKFQQSRLSRARGINGFALVPDASAFVSWTCRNTNNIMKRPNPPIKTGTSAASAILNCHASQGVRHPRSSVCDEVKPKRSKKSEIPINAEPRKSNRLSLP